MNHLIAEAVLRSRGYHGTLFLDVYTDNQKAIDLYRRFGFEQIGPPRKDDQEGGREYIVMAKSVAMEY